MTLTIQKYLTVKTFCQLQYLFFVVCYYHMNICFLCYSENGQLQMIVESGRFQIEHIRKRRVYVFHVAGERDWCIRYTRLSEYPIPVIYAYRNDAVVELGNGKDNKEIEVSEQFQ